MSRLVVPVLCSAALLVGCGTGSAENGKSGERADGFGDPFVTDSQVRAVHIGEAQAKAFAQLGGKANSGEEGTRKAFRRAYDYPIRGTGSANGTAEESDAATWWEICTEHGRVVGKQRGKMESMAGECGLPAEGESGQ